MLIQSHDLQLHLYADDTQIYVFCQPSDSSSLESRMSDCFSAVADWMSSNRLQLNTTKTEIFWCPCTSSRRQHQLPTNRLTVGNDQVTPVTSVRNIGIYRRRFIHANTCPPNRCRLLCCSSSHQKYLTVRHSASATVARVGFSTVTSWLR